MASRATKSKSRDRPPRIGYFLRAYPRFSQTFVVNEILELERQGLDARACSPGTMGAESTAPHATLRC